MKTPFYAAANKVINMYALRQERASVKAPPHTPAEVYWACEMLRDIAAAAAYAASNEAAVIKDTADLWQNTNTQPDLFPAPQYVIPNCEVE